MQNRALWSQIVVSALLVAALVAGKATRDALFLARFGSDALPRAMAISSILALISAFVASALMRRYGPLRSTNILVLTSAALLAGEAATYHAAPELVVPLIYIQVGALGAATLSGFWASVTEHFDAHSARAAARAYRGRSPRRRAPGRPRRGALARALRRPGPARDARRAARGRGAPAEHPARGGRLGRDPRELGPRAR